MQEGDSAALSDPLLRNRRRNAPVLGDWVVLLFTDEQMVFCHVGEQVVFNKRKYVSKFLAGKPYETIFEARSGGLWPLDETEKLIPNVNVEQYLGTDPDAQAKVLDVDKQEKRDNRSLDDTNTAQGLSISDVQQLKRAGQGGASLVESLVENSATFSSKTVFSQEKYIRRKQRKHLARCRMQRCTASTICRTLHTQNPKRIMSLRPDTLAQIMSYTNLAAGCQTVIYETTAGLITGAVAQRLGGYGRILSLYSGHQHSFSELLGKYNLSFGEISAINWVHAGDVYGEAPNLDVSDAEATDRDKVQWPCLPVQHTFDYLQENPSIDKKEYFGRQASRFLRKMCRTTPTEAYTMLSNKDRMCDSIILATNYDVVATFMPLYEFLAPCSPFCIYSECVEPLLECFRKLQNDELAINLRLSDTWAREFQILDQRTHPMMNMSQSGGFLLTGTKLHSVTGKTDLDQATKDEVKGQWRKKVRRNMQWNTRG